MIKGSFTPQDPEENSSVSVRREVRKFCRVEIRGLPSVAWISFPEPGLGRTLMVTLHPPFDATISRSGDFSLTDTRRKRRRDSPRHFHGERPTSALTHTNTRPLPSSVQPLEYKNLSRQERLDVPSDHRPIRVLGRTTVETMS